jgi:hypothetical protein
VAATRGALSMAGVAWLAEVRRSSAGPLSQAARGVLADAARLLALDLRGLRRAPRSLRSFVAARLCRALGLAGLVLSNGLCAVQLAGGAAPSSQLLGVSFTSVALVLSALTLRWALRLQRSAPRAGGESLALAAQEFPAVVELGAPLELDSLFLEPTLLHDVMHALATCDSRRSWQHAATYAAALRRALWLELPEARIDARRWLGKPRAAGVAELVVDDAVLLQVEVGLDRERIHAVLEQVRAHAASWGARPIVVVAFQSSIADLTSDEVVAAITAARGSVPLVLAVAR